MTSVFSRTLRSFCDRSVCPLFLFLLVSSTAFAEQSSSLSPFELDFAKEELGATSVSVQQLKVPLIRGKRFHISLRVSRDTFAPELELGRVLSDTPPLLSVGDGINPPEVRHLESATLYRLVPELSPLSRSLVRGSFLFLDDGLSGSFETADIDQFNQEIAASARRFFMTPVRSIFPDSQYPSDLHFIYPATDPHHSERPLQCSLNSEQSVDSSSQNFSAPVPGASGCSSPVPSDVIARIGVVADYCYWARLPGSSDTVKQNLAGLLIQHSIFEANNAFNDVGVENRIGLIHFDNTVDLNCHLNSGVDYHNTLLNFKAYWTNDPFLSQMSSLLSISNAALYIGKPWTNVLVGGVAYSLLGGGVPNTCDQQRFFSVTDFSKRNPASNPTTPRYFRIHHLNAVSTHELVHNWGVPHCTDNGISTNYCGLMSGMGLNSSTGFPNLLLDSHSAGIITCNKNISCLTPTSPPSPPRPMPTRDDFSTPGLLSTFWDYGIGYRFPGNGHLRLETSFPTFTAESAYLVSQRFKLPLFDPRHPQQLLIKLVAPKMTASSNSIFNIELLDKTLLWRNVFRMRPSELVNSIDAELTIPVPLDVLDPEDFRIRLGVDLEAGDAVEIESIELTTRPIRNTVQYNMAHRLVTADLSGEGVDELVISEPNITSTGQGLGQVRIYHRNDFVVPKALLQGNYGEGFGSEIAVIHDITGDGVAELAVGIPATFNGHSSGNNPRVEIFAGRQVLSSTLSNPVLPLLELEGSHDTDFPGPVHGVVDLNDDTFADILVGVPGDYNNLGVQTGSIRLYSGRDGSLISTVYGLNGGDRFGCSLDVVDRSEFTAPISSLSVSDAFLMVGSCGGQYARLYKASPSPSTPHINLLRTETLAAMSHLLPGVSGVVRFGHTVKFLGTLPAISITGLRFDSSNQPISAGSIYASSLTPTIPGRMLTSSGPDETGFGSAFGNAPLWEETASGIASVSYNTHSTSYLKDVQLSITRNGIQEIAQFENSVSIFSPPEFQLAIGDVDGDQLPDFVYGLKSQCSFYQNCSKAFLYLSRGLESGTPKGAGQKFASTEFLLGHIFSRSPLTAMIPSSGSTQNGAVTFQIRGASANPLYTDYIFVGKRIVKTKNSGLPVDMKGQSIPSQFLSILPGGENIVVPEAIVTLPTYLPPSLFPHTASGNNALHYNYEPAQTFSFVPSTSLSGKYFHQYLRVQRSQYSSTPLVHVGNIVEIDYQ